MNAEQAARLAGTKAGTNARTPMSSFEMFQYNENFVIGYIAGHSFAESVRMASPTAAAVTVGTLAHEYQQDINVVCQHMGFSHELRNVAMSFFESSRELEAFEGDFEED